MVDKLENIINFLESNGWKRIKRGKLFDIYQPPNNLELPQEFYLEIPNTQHYRGFKKYIKGIIEILDDVYSEWKTLH